MEISPADAGPLGIGDGDLVRVESPRGHLRAPATAFRDAAATHGGEPDVVRICERLAGQCDEHVRALRPFVERYAGDTSDEPGRPRSSLFSGARDGGLGLLRDPHGLCLMAADCDICWALIGQAAQGARDEPLLETAGRDEDEAAVRLLWLRTRMKQAAPQTLVVSTG
ncbi:molybdopterin dinucleotide binding domain-containing protein [Nonomuraea sp. NPDC050643]|uniref:molybdopterin dinucleotide binding domain-containing protein n=1 Tax=Nonomuraea sp. NPDC050643 TaxID=3155660 RepID=UPI0033FC49DD